MDGRPVSSPIDGKTVKTMKIEGLSMLIDFDDGSQMTLEPGVQPTEAGHYRLSLGVSLTAPTVVEPRYTGTSYSLELQSNTSGWAGLGRFDFRSQMAAFQEAQSISQHNATVRVVDTKTRLVFKTYRNGKVLDE